jgi:hypothetical protein
MPFLFQILMISIHCQHQKYKELYGQTRDAPSIQMQKRKLLSTELFTPGMQKSLAPGQVAVATIFYDGA